MKTTIRFSLRHSLSLLVVVTFMVPTRSNVFGGLPIATLPSLVALLFCALVVPALASRLSSRMCKRLLVVSLLLLILRVSGTFVESGSWRTCLRSPRVDVERTCGFSFERPFSTSLTRLDSVIDVGSPSPIASIVETNWNLSFLNEMRYNDYRGPALDPRRPRFSATWRPEGDLPPGVVLKFVGTARVTSAGKVFEGSSFDEVGTLAIPDNGGDIVVRLSWPSLIQVGAPADMYAFARLETTDGRLVRPVRSTPDLVVTRAGELMAVLLLGVLFATSLAATTREGRRRVLGTLALGGALTALDLRVLGNGAPSLAFWLPAVAFTVFLWIAPALNRVERRYGLSLAFLGLVLRFETTFSARLPLSQMVYRSVGDDNLAYQSFAREIVRDHTLRGGENLYFFQPGGRYAFAALHILFGERDRLIASATMWFVYAAVVFLVVCVAQRLGAWRPVAGLAGAALWVLFDSQAANAFSGLIEAFSWALLVFAATFLFFSTPGSGRTVGLLCLGLSTFVRVNNAFGAMAVVVAVVVVQRIRGFAIVRAVVLGNLGILLCIAHNFWWARVIQVLKVSDVTVAVPRRDLLRLWDPSVRGALRDQIFNMLYLSRTEPLYPNYGFGFFCAASVGAWFVANAWRISRPVGIRPFLRSSLVLVLPLGGFLGIYLSFRLNIYYPRHLVVGYLWLVLGGLYLFVRTVQDERSPMPEDHAVSQDASLRVP